MKWFKHYASLGEKDFSQRLIQKHGVQAYGRYLLLLEACSKVHGDRPDGKFALSKLQLASKLAARPFQLASILTAIGAEMDFTFTETDYEFILDVPILSELRHKDSISYKIRRASGGPASGQVARRDKEEEKEKEVEYISSDKPQKAELRVLPKSKPNQDSSHSLNARIWDSYRKAYLARWNIPPVRNAKVNASVDQLGKRLGEDAPEVVSFFVAHNSAFYVQKTHDIGLCLKDAETLRTQWARGRAITSSDVKQFEKTNYYQEQLERLSKP